MAKCNHCNQSIKGRADKIYCSAVCKSRAHRLGQSKNNYQQKVDVILRNNYKILDRLFDKGKAAKITIDHLTLAELGFQFDYCTRVYLNNQGKWYRYIYEFSWMEFSDQKVQVFRSKK